MKADNLDRSLESAIAYKTYLEERFQGEVYGEAFFRTMAALCETPERARKFRVLQQLERETKEFLLPVLIGVGSAGEEDPERISAGEALGTQLATIPWLDLMRGFHRELERFVREFEQAEALAPPGKESLLQHVTAHERALLDFAIRELAGDERGDSLERTVQLLRGSAAV